MSEANATNVVVQSPAVGDLDAAYARHLSAISAIPNAQFITINLDIDSVFTKGMAALMRARAFRPAMLELSSLDKSMIENCESYLLALGAAHANHLAAIAPVGGLAEKYSQLLKSRELLVADAGNLAVRGLIPAEKLNELKGPVSPTATAFDVLALLKLLESHAERIGNKSTLTVEEKLLARIQAERVLGAVTDRVLSDEEVAEATRLRQAAFTLFVRAYEEVRRAMLFLRHHEGDAETYAPSLYSLQIGRRRREKGKDDKEGANGEPELGTTPVASPPQADPKSAPNPDAPVGHPDSAPFLKTA